MRFLENEIKRFEKRIKRIRENPDPARLRSTEMLYQLEIDDRVWQLEAVRDGKLIADGWGLHPLLRAMGFIILDFDRASDKTAAADPDRYLKAIRTAGLPVWGCDRTLTMVTLCTTGDYPVPSFLLNSSIVCTPMMLGLNSLATWFNVPSVTVDIPLEANEANLRYTTDQLHEAIEFAEAKVPGVKYDEDKLIEFQEYDRISYEYQKEIALLAKRVPCPLDPQDIFRLPRLPSAYPDPRKVVDYYRIYRDEVYERAEKHIGAVREEKLRVMWAVSGPFQGNVFRVLVERGASLPVFHVGATPFLTGRYSLYGDEKEYGRKLSPLEEEARRLNRNSFNGLGMRRWVEEILFECQFYNIDAIVHFNQVGCVACTPLAKIVSDKAESELGVKTLIVEGRNIDEGDHNRRDLENRLAEFIDICLNEKGKKRDRV